MINFNEARATKAKDARLWTVLDCLKAVIRDLENGELKADAVYVAMMRKGEDGQAIGFPFYTAGMTGVEVRGVLAQHLHDHCSAFG